MNWAKIWMDLFGTTTLWGLNMGFWVSMGVVLLIVILMNVVFWSMKPKKKDSTDVKKGDPLMDKNESRSRI